MISWFHYKHNFYLFPWNFPHFLKSLECELCCCYNQQAKNSIERVPLGITFLKGRQPRSHNRSFSCVCLCKMSAGDVHEAFSVELSIILWRSPLQTPCHTPSQSSWVIPPHRQGCWDRTACLTPANCALLGGRVSKMLRNSWKPPPCEAAIK